jgi:hypothetical protein
MVNSIIDMIYTENQDPGFGGNLETFNSEGLSYSHGQGIRN